MAEKKDERKSVEGQDATTKRCKAGLVIPKRTTATERPAQPSGRLSAAARRPITVRSEFPPIEINSHRELAERSQEIMARLNAEPELAAMLFINPVLAMQDVNVKLSTEIAHHVLHATQHPPETRKRRDALEEKIKKELDQTPQPNNPAWVSEVLFQRLNVQPLDTRGANPIYKPALNAAAIERLQKRRPRAKPKYDLRLKARGTASVRLKEWSAAVRRLDLDAQLPQLPQAPEPPQEVTLEELYFYRDSHPLIRDLLELGVLQRLSFPIHTGDAYRKIKAGERPNAFRAWFRNVRFKEPER